MVLLLTILSVLAVWGLLAVLLTGLLIIVKALESVRRNLEQIAMGVRAIEAETAPLGPQGARLRGHIADVTEAMNALAANFDRSARLLRGGDVSVH